MYGDKKTCSVFCLNKIRLQNGEPGRRKLRFKYFIERRNADKLAHDKALWEARHPIVIH